MHTIRLRAAWTIEDGRGVRRFNRPTGIDGGQRVWLAWDGLANSAWLNEEQLDKHQHCGPSRYEVTELLLPSNVLTLGTDNGAVLQTVRLEIEEPEQDKADGQGASC